ncbi:hypothetical protein QQM79_20900 [Marinobacteraceae bacterium S3BR75-40.1]
MDVIDYLTAILVFITAIYAYLTHRMAKASEASVNAMREQSEALIRPYVTVTPYVRPHTTILYLKIENTGKTAAEDLTLSLNKDFFQFGETDNSEKNLRTANAFTEVIESMPPGTKLHFALAQGFKIFGDEADENAAPQQFEITAKYKFGKKEYNERHRIDLRPYIGTEGERDPLVEEMERLRKLVQGWK